MKMLKSRLYEEEMRKREALKNAANSSKKKIEWGSQIRSYVFHPYKMIKDHRTDYEVGNVQPVMDGELDGFIKAYLMMEKETEFNCGIKSSNSSTVSKPLLVTTYICHGFSYFLPVSVKLLSQVV